MNPETARMLFFQSYSRILGRASLVAAFLLGADGRSGAALACLAVALWMMWTSLLHLGAEIGLALEKQETIQ